MRVTKTEDDYKGDVLQEIREAYGRATYSKTAFNKEYHIRFEGYKKIKIWQIVLSAITFCSWLGFIVIDQKISACIGVICSAILFGLNLYVKENQSLEQMELYRQGADELWLICENYRALMTDFPMLSSQEIKQKREELVQKLGDVYSKYPKTSSKAYKQTQQALKEEEEQFFSDEELNKMLPKHLRKIEK